MALANSKITIYWEIKESTSNFPQKAEKGQSLFSPSIHLYCMKKGG